MNSGIFREYDIRGLAEKDLTDNVAWALGRTLADEIKRRGDHCTYVGQDVRLSSPRLARALSCGLEAGGVAVRMLKPGPTPLLYFAAHEAVGDFKTKSGIMVTGSHNPPEYNGFKMVIAGSTLFGPDIQDMREKVEHYLSSAPTNFTPKAVAVDREPDYVAFVKNTIRCDRKIKVVVDGGNGAGGPLGLATYRAMGCEVVPLFCDPDGRFPNHHPDPTVPKNLAALIEKVKSEKADLGIAFDGDGDRIGAVSSSGAILFGDSLVLYFARDILREVPGATIISEVKSSQLLYDMLQKWGAQPILWKTGHSLIKAKLKETKAALAGEMSGHIFFAHRFFGFDDAIYSGARLIEGLSQKEESLDEFLNSLPKMFNTPELRVDCSDSTKFKVVSAFVEKARQRFGNDLNDIDGARIKMHGGWGLLRASNTQPVLVMRFEAPSTEKLQNVRQEFMALLKDIDSSIQVPEL